MRISGGMREIAVIAHTCVAKWMLSARQAIGGNYKRNTKESRYSNLYANVGGWAEPALRADDSDVFFSWSARGSGHVYPHLNKTPEEELCWRRSVPLLMLVEEDSCCSSCCRCCRWRRTDGCGRRSSAQSAPGHRSGRSPSRSAGVARRRGVAVLSRRRGFCILMLTVGSSSGRGMRRAPCTKGCGRTPPGGG